MFTELSEHGRGGYEVLFIEELNNGYFEAMVRPGRRFRKGKRHLMPGGNLLEVDEILESGTRILHFVNTHEPVEVFKRYGEMPLPPYITSRESSPDRYQTVYSDIEGSVAAPTAGLHFDDEVFNRLSEKGVSITDIVLHVGPGTFKPVECDNLAEHKMHEEKFMVSEQTAELFSRTRAEKGRVWACGTTSVRTLESAFLPDGALKTGWQATDCFITPGYRYNAVDCLITNFHLPRSTLIMLVSAFASREEVLRIYEEAVKNKYRFYSFGDSMVII
jgi:S-adenosylmethionine:tRNA ribosyltransferase-isomerase